MWEVNNVAVKAADPAPQQSTFCTSKGYKAGCTITSYYYFNGQRVAMTRSPFRFTER